MSSANMTKESSSSGIQTKEPVSSLTTSNSHDCFNRQLACPSTNPSSDNLRGYVTPSSTWGSESNMGASLGSPKGSSTNLISRHVDGSEASCVDTGASTPVFNPKHPARSLYRTLHETMQLEPPYHVFPRAKKKTLMYLAAIAGMFSSLSANIYFPALGQISRVC